LPEPVAMTEAEFQELKELQRKRRWDWPAWFSSNQSGEIWACMGRGWSKREDRIDLRGISPVLDKIAKNYQYFRSDRGRFFINDEGAFYKEQAREAIQFVEFPNGVVRKD
jgi:hypothetical protein